MVETVVTSLVDVLPRGDRGEVTTWVNHSSFKQNFRLDYLVNQDWLGLQGLEEPMERLGLRVPREIEVIGERRGLWEGGKGTSIS